MTVYAVASGKGGVGKTTTAIALGACTAAAGRKTVVVDADLGMPDMAAVLDLSTDGPTLHDVLAGSADIMDAVQDVAGGFDAIPGGADLADYAAGDPAGLQTVVNTLRETYDIIILDTAAGLSQDVLVPLGVADETILVSTPAAAALQDAEKTRQLVDRVDGRVAGIIITRVIDVDSSEVTSTDNVTLLGMVPEDSSVREAEQAHQPVTVHAPDGPAGSAYIEATAALVEVAVGEVAPETTTATQSEPEAVPFADDDTESESPDESEPSTASITEDQDTPTDEGPPEGPMVETDDDDTEEESSRSLLNRLTGGLLG